MVFILFTLNGLGLILYVLSIQYPMIMMHVGHDLKRSTMEHLSLNGMELCVHNMKAVDQDLHI